MTRAGWARVTVLTVAAIVVSWWPVVALGNPHGEADNHLWMIWLAFEGKGPWYNLPVGGDMQLMDPINLLWWAPTWWLGPRVAWTAAILGNIALAAVSGGAVGWHVTQREAGALVGAITLSTSPFLVGAVDFSITEAWTVGWLGLHVVFALRLRDTGRWQDAALSGAALAAWLASGWYACAFAIFVECLLALHVRRWRWMIGQALLAGATELPRLATFLAMREQWAPRFATSTQGIDNPQWRIALMHGTDLLNLLAPSWIANGPSTAVYIGLTTLALATFGGRRALPFLAMAAVFWTLALGHWLRVGGHTIVAMPAGWLAANTPLNGISHWYRAAGPATVFSAIAAAIGAARVTDRWGRGLGLVVAIAGVLVAENMIAAPVAWPRTTYHPRLPTGMTVIDAPLIQLPLQGIQPIPMSESARPYAQWQVFHGQRVAENYEWPDAIRRKSAMVSRWDDACQTAPLSAGRKLSDIADADGEIVRLVAWGFRWVVVHPQFSTATCASVVSAALGEPAFTTAEALGWRIGTAAK